jgi:Tfp pilus assembly protein FimV
VALTLAASTAQAGGDDTVGRVARAPKPVVRTYVVRPGDTLWSIASRFAAPDADPRPMVDALAGANHLDGALAVGSRLVIPA